MHTAVTVVRGTWQSSQPSIPSAVLHTEGVAYAIAIANGIGIVTALSVACEQRQKL